MKLKKWLLAAGCTKEELSSCTGREELLLMLPRYRGPG